MVTPPFLWRPTRPVRCNDDPDLPIGQFICQDVKLPARRGFPICRIPKEKLIHGDVIAGHELKKDLEARMLPLVLNIGEIAGRKIHLVPHFVAGLFLPRPCCFYCCPIRLKSIFCTGLFAIFIHQTTFYSSPFFLDMSL